MEDFPLGVKVAKACPVLGVVQDFVVYHAKASALVGSTLSRLQHVQVHLLLGVVESLDDTFAADFVALRTPAVRGLTIETQKAVSFPFTFKWPGLRLS